MAVKEYTTSYPVSQDPDPIQTVQPDLVNESAPGMGDGDNTRASQLHILRDKLHALAKKVGDNSSLPFGCALDKISKLIDTKLAWIYYKDAASIDVKAAPGSSSTVKITLQDGKQRSFTGTLAWTFVTGVGDLGLDTGTEQASRWYYLYLIPKSGDDNSLSCRASINDPSTGPTGYANWAYIGAFRNDGSSNIIQFYQNSEDIFKYYGVVQPADSVALGTTYYSSGTTISLLDSVPVTASEADLWFRGSRTGAAAGVVLFQIRVFGGATANVNCRTPGNAIGAHNEFAGAFVNIPLPDSLKRISFWSSIESGAPLINNQSVFCRGWIDSYLS